jgi:hypothetical protein
VVRVRKWGTIAAVIVTIASAFLVLITAALTY